MDITMSILNALKQLAASPLDTHESQLSPDYVRGDATLFAAMRAGAIWLSRQKARTKKNVGSIVSAAQGEQIFRNHCQASSANSSHPDRQQQISHSPINSHEHEKFILAPSPGARPQDHWILSG
jgi:hypothetical protein